MQQTFNFKGLLSVAVLGSCLLVQNAFAQVTVTGSSGGGAVNTTFSTLKAAFDALNTQTTQAGRAITISITGNTTETATARLNQPSVSTWTSLTISPTGGAARTISGAIAAGFPLIDLNGANNVTINGLNSGGNALTLVNTTVSATAGTSTIPFVNDATNNTITNCTVNGASTMASTTNGGTIWFGTTTGTNGNDNNTISACNIGADGTNLPAKAICSLGTSTSLAHYNSNNTITGCNIFDFFSATVVSSGLFLGQATTNWTISNNKLYQTATRTQTTGAVHAGVEVASNVGNNNHLISGNTIGYSNSTGTGTYTFIGVDGSRFYPIYFSDGGSTTPSIIQNNIITNITLPTANISGVPFIGIFMANPTTGWTNITGNTIGSTTNNAINISSSSSLNSGLC